MKKKQTRFLSLALSLALTLGLAPAALAAAPDTSAVTPQSYLDDIKVDKSTQTRVIITTDGECDDMNSIRHMLLYANDIDIAGLVYSAAQHHWQGDGVHTLKEITPNYRCEGIWKTGDHERAGGLMECRPVRIDEDGQGGWLHDIIKDEYAKDYVFLSQNDPNYPTPEQLLSVTKVGNVLFEGDVRFETEGSNLIKDAILDDDPRLLHLQVWGGANTIVRALMSIYETYKDTDQWDTIYQKVCSKVAVEFSTQDNSWEDQDIPGKFPDLMMLGYSTVGVGFDGADGVPEPLKQYYKAGFLAPNIKFGHGELMSHYLLMNDGTELYGESGHLQFGLLKVIDWGFLIWYRDTYDWVGEGDTTHWLPMANVGLRGLESMDSYNYGSWGGRLTWTTASGKVLRQPENLSSEYNPITGELNNYGGLRFGENVFLDWAARADWAVNSFENCNHPAVVRAEQLDIEAFPGDVVDLNGKVYDPDGNALDLKWWVYDEGSKYSGSASNLRVWEENALSTKFSVPADAAPGDYFNVILEVTDKAGEYSSFTRYAQVIIQVPNRSFRDVLEDSPYFEAIEKVSAAGLISGVGKRNFDADGPVQAKQLVAVLGRLSGEAPYFENFFDSFSADAWYTGYDAWAKETGIVSGGMDYNAVLTAEQIDGMISAYAASAGLTYTAGTGATRGDLAVRLAGLIQ